MIPSNHLILCLPLLLLSSIFPSIRVFSSEPTLGRPRGWLHVPSYKWGLHQTWKVSGFCSLGSSLRCSLTPWGNHTSQGSGISLIYNPPVNQVLSFLSWFKQMSIPFAFKTVLVCTLVNGYIHSNCNQAPCMTQQSHSNPRCVPSRNAVGTRARMFHNWVSHNHPKLETTQIPITVKQIRKLCWGLRKRTG